MAMYIPNKIPNLDQILGKCGLGQELKESKLDQVKYII